MGYITSVELFMDLKPRIYEACTGIWKARHFKLRPWSSRIDYCKISHLAILRKLKTHLAKWKLNYLSCAWMKNTMIFYLHQNLICCDLLQKCQKWQNSSKYLVYIYICMHFDAVILLLQYLSLQRFSLKWDKQMQ